MAATIDVTQLSLGHVFLSVSGLEMPGDEKRFVFYKFCSVGEEAVEISLD